MKSNLQFLLVLLTCLIYQTTCHFFHKHHGKHREFGHRGHHGHHGRHTVNPPLHCIPVPCIPTSCPSHKCPAVKICPNPVWPSPSHTTARPKCPCEDKTTTIKKCYNIEWTKNPYLITKGQLELISAVFSISYTTYSIQDLTSIYTSLEVDHKQLVTENVDLQLELEVPAFDPATSKEVCPSTDELQKTLNNLNITSIDLQEQELRLENTFKEFQERKKNCQESESRELGIEVPALSTGTRSLRGIINPFLGPVRRTSTSDRIAFNKPSNNTNRGVLKQQNTHTWSILSNLTIQTITQQKIHLAIQQLLRYELLTTCVSKVSAITETSFKTSSIFTTEIEIIEQMQLLFLQYVEIQLINGELHKKLGERNNKCGNNNIHTLQSKIANKNSNIFELRKKITVINSLIQTEIQEWQICVGTRNGL